MSTWGERLGAKGRRIGVGASIAPEEVPQPQPVIYGQFSGIDQASPPVLVPFGAGIRESIDIELSRDGSLRRAPGLNQVENAFGHSFRYAFTQTSPDGSIVLLVLDPPYFGIRGAGATVWTNVALPATGPFGWVAANHGGVELFSNAQGATSYARQYGSLVLESVADMPPARTIASAFARVFIGAPLLGGVFENLTILWSGATGFYNDWTGLGAGGESLITDLAWADRLVALRPLGYDLLCVLMRNSIWFGYPTGELQRPADFRSKFGGLGCVAEATARTTLLGVVFLSDDGVYLTDGNSAVMISGQINEELLDLDYANIRLYSAAYDGYRKRYILTTPSATWIYEFPRQELGRPARWYKRSFIADNVIGYADQAAQPTWDDAVDTWDTTVGTWDADGPAGLETPAKVFFSKGALLGIETYGIFRNFELPFTGLWRGAPGLREDLTGLVSTHSYELHYRQGGRIIISTPNVEGDAFESRANLLLPDRGLLYGSAKLSRLAVGRAGLQIEFPPPETPDELVEDLTVLSDEEVVLISPAGTGAGVTVTVEPGGLLETFGTPDLPNSPEVAMVKVLVTPTGPGTSL